MLRIKSELFNGIVSKDVVVVAAAAAYCLIANTKVHKNAHSRDSGVLRREAPQRWMNLFNTERRFISFIIWL